MGTTALILPRTLVMEWDPSVKNVFRELHPVPELPRRTLCRWVTHSNQSSSQPFWCERQWVHHRWGFGGMQSCTRQSSYCWWGDVVFKDLPVSKKNQETHH